MLDHLRMPWHIWNDDSENDPYKILWLTCKLEGARQRGTKSCQVMPDNHLIIVFTILLAFDSIMNLKVTWGQPSLASSSIEITPRKKSMEATFVTI